MRGAGRCRPTYTSSPEVGRVASRPRKSNLSSSDTVDPRYQSIIADSPSWVVISCWGPVGQMWHAINRYHHHYYDSMTLPNCPRNRISSAVTTTVVAAWGPTTAMPVGRACPNKLSTALPVKEFRAEESCRVPSTTSVQWHISFQSSAELHGSCRLSIHGTLMVW